jgi:hypothetical protein
MFRWSFLLLCMLVVSLTTVATVHANEVQTRHSLRPRPASNVLAKFTVKGTAINRRAIPIKLFPIIMVATVGLLPARPRH